MTLAVTPAVPLTSTPILPAFSTLTRIDPPARARHVDQQQLADEYERSRNGEL
ncbi:hypothetical protein [Streptomyces sp. NBC_01579]|uniref:hypothetical protein n=1 Tax=Streptomyces sp. NBC_01579 TaxID=2975885 RepID=UPI00386454A0